MITSKNISRANVWETLNQDRGLFMTGFLRAFDVLITWKEMQNSQMFWTWETIFQSLFQGQCFVEHILGNADLGRRDRRNDYAISDISCHFPTSYYMQT